MAARGVSTRVAIVGAGPKGMHAAECLARASRAHGATVEVDIFEPHPCPGAGPVYDPQQPPWLRMNVPAGPVSAGPSEGDDPFPDFVAWSRMHGVAVDPDAFVPRAQVGAYLADAFAAVMDGCTPPPRCVAQRVTAITPNGSGHTVEAPTPHGPYDEVIIATGHAARWSGALTAGDASVPVVDQVFPVDAWQQHVPPGAVVAVRGYALTFIDVALTLSEGRGSTFGAGPGGRLRLRRHGAQAPAVLIPFARTGQPMWPKPGRRLAPLLERMEAETHGWMLPDRPATLDGLTDALAEVAAAAHVAAGAHRDRAAGQVRAALNAMVEGDAAAGVDPRRALAHGVAMAGGHVPVDAAWCLAQTWRATGAQVSRRVGGGGLTGAALRGFRRLAAAMEPRAYGPPLSTATRIRALVDAGMVDLTHVRGGRLTVAEDGHTYVTSDAGAPRRVDVVIDAVLAPPGPDDLLTGLIARGHARTVDGGRGVEVAEDGQLIGADGQRRAGLSAIGRATEDSVVGNDTLFRHLHEVAERWAQRVARDAARRDGVVAV